MKRKLRPDRVKRAVLHGHADLNGHDNLRQGIIYQSVSIPIYFCTVNPFPEGRRCFSFIRHRKGGIRELLKMVITKFKTDIYDSIESLVEQGANVKLEVTPADLKMFAEAIVQRTMAARQEELNAEMRRVAEETWLNTRQVRELLNVCEGTLNLWAKRGYLVPVKVGNKNMYARSDVRRVQTGGKSESVTSYCKKKNG